MINSKEEMIELYQGAIDGKEYEKLELKEGAFTGDVKEVWTKHCTDFGFSIGTTYKEIEKFDITKHKWRDADIHNCLTDFDSDIHFKVTVRDNPAEVYISKCDAIAIAKHFYSQLKTKEEKNAFLDDITAVKDD